MSSFIVDTTEVSMPEEWKEKEIEQRVGWTVISHQSLGVVEVSFQNEQMFIDDQLVAQYRTIKQQRYDSGSFSTHTLASASLEVKAHFAFGALALNELLKRARAVWHSDRISFKEDPFSAISTKELIEGLVGNIVLPDAILDFLISHQNNYVVKRYLLKRIRPNAPSFWGTQYKNRSGDVCVRSLIWVGSETEGEWYWIPNYLHNPQFHFLFPFVLEPKK